MTQTELWIVIAVLGIGSFSMRFLFLGLIGGRQLPEWVLRHLRYTAVAILPALAAPLAVWPQGPGSDVDVLRIAAAILALVVGALTKNVFAAMGLGGALFWGLPAIWPA